MQSVSLKLDSALSKQVERDIKEFKYSTKTEFIREAIRDKLRDNEKERAWKALFAARGVFKGQALTDEEFYRKREEFSKKLEKELRKKYNIK